MKIAAKALGGSRWACGSFVRDTSKLSQKAEGYIDETDSVGEALEVCSPVGPSVENQSSSEGGINSQECVSRVRFTGRKFLWGMCSYMIDPFHVQGVGRLQCYKIDRPDGELTMQLTSQLATATYGHFPITSWGSPAH
jgi:hypothetical protein